jgi:hypothetical protein
MTITTFGTDVGSAAAGTGAGTEEIRTKALNDDAANANGIRNRLIALG